MPLIHENGGLLKNLHVLVKIISTNSEVTSMTIDRVDRLWTLPRMDEVKVYNLKSLLPLDIFDDKTKHSFETNKFFDIKENSDGKIWLAAWYPKGFGITYYDERKKSIEEIATQNAHELFTGDYFYNISLSKEDKSSMAFLGFGGVNFVTKGGFISGRIDLSLSINKLSLPTTQKVIVDSLGNTWLASTDGLYFINKAKTRMALILELDGLSSNDVSNGFALTTDNKLLMSSTNSIEMLDVIEFSKNNDLPTLNLSAISIIGKTRRVNLDSTLVFERNENNLSFSFSPLTYLKPSQYFFQYRYDGDTNWIDNGTSNIIIFSNMKHGEYNFEVRVGDSFGNWANESSKIYFKVRPLYYETLLFKMVILFLIFGLIAAFFHAKLLAIKKELVKDNAISKLKEEQNNMDSELTNTKNLLQSTQLDALRSQMNPHFIFNSLNSIENYILKNEKLKASEYLGKFSKLIRNILDNSKSEQIPLYKEIETLRLYIELERLRTGNNFDVIYFIPDYLLDDNILIPPMLMQPHVENAILHGLRYLEEQRGKLIISLQVINDEFLDYTIQDNGIGRKKAHDLKTYNNPEHKSYGLDITNKRIEIYNQKFSQQIKFNIEDITDESDFCIGTKVSILLPLT